jgi:SAM-dependent methyltransferase
VVGLTRPDDEARWHDVECASYEADLDLWLSLAEHAHGPILDIGCGTGRVSLRLAAAGYDVTALDSDPALVRTLAQRAREHAVELRTSVGDARSFALGARFALAIAPMQVVQLLGGARGRGALLDRAREHLLPGGVLAVALADPFEAVAVDAADPPLPDVLETDGWVYSSMPVAVYPDGDATTIERVRQSVSPSGELSESVATIRLDTVTPGELYEEGVAHGFVARPRLSVPPTEDYLGSTVVVMERAA